MENIRFDATETIGTVVLETALYRQIHYPDMLSKYDSNFIEFKKLPTVSEFKEVADYLRDYHQERGQYHIKFYLPENAPLEGELWTYLKDAGYISELLELYAILPSDFPKVTVEPKIEIQPVTQATLELFIELNYRQDIAFGDTFAQEKTAYIRRQFANEAHQQVLAFYQGVAVGYVNLIVSEDTVEIDELTVEERYQKKGIGSQLQHFAMTTHPQHTILLIADGADTPREMYRKQNYRYLGCRYTLLKEYATAS